MSYTKKILLFVAVIIIRVTSIRVRTATQATQTEEDKIDERNAYLVNGATFSIGLMMAYPDLLYVTSEECTNKINRYNEHFNLFEQHILQAIDYSSDGMGDFKDYENCGDMEGFRYLMATWSDQLRSVKYGIWSPEVCTANDFEQFIEIFLYSLYTGKINIEVHKEELINFLAFPRMVYDSNKENDNAKSIKAKHVLTLIFFTIGIIAVIFGTLYHLFLRITDQIEDDDYEHRNLNLIYEREFNVNNIVLGFSIFRSFERLTNPYSKYTAPGLSTLRGLKALLWIYLATTWFYYISLVPSVDGYTFNDNDSKDFGFAPFKSSICIVDILLWVSGIYTAYSIYSSIKVYNSSNTEIVGIFGIELLYKFLRLFPIMFYWVIYFGWIVPTYGSGPAFSELDYFNESKMDKYWWTNFLFIDNIYPKTEKQPMLWGSFFSLEIQLFLIFFPMIVLIIYNEMIGYLTLSSFWLGSLITAFFYSKSKDLELSSYVNAGEVGRYIV